MKPDWDKLMDDFKDSKTSLVADVDCTAEGKDLCEKNGVTGFPTIKHGDPTDLKDYSGGRSYDDLKKFADENLGPSCSPENIDLCTDDDKALIQKFQAMTDDELDKEIAEVDAKISKAEEKSTKAVAKLQSQIEDLQKRVEAETKKKDDNVKKESKKLGLTVMRKVASAKKKKENEGPSKKKKKKSKGT